MLGPAKPPLDLDFQATSFGSQMSCRALTGLCAAHSTVGDSSPEPSDFNFVCNATVAGLNMTGNFMNVSAPQDESGLSSGPAVTNATHGNETDPYLVVLGGNTIAGNSFSIGFQYFDDSQRLAQTPYLNEYYGSGGDDRYQLYWALVWWAPFTTVLTHGYTPLGVNTTFALDTPVTNETATNREEDFLGFSPARRIYQKLYVALVPILEIVLVMLAQTYSFNDGTMGIDSLRVPRTNASIPFVVGVTARK